MALRVYFSGLEARGGFQEWTSRSACNKYVTIEFLFQKFEEALNYEKSLEGKLFVRLCGQKPKFNYEEVDAFMERIAEGRVPQLSCFHPLYDLKNKLGKPLPPPPCCGSKTGSNPYTGYVKAAFSLVFGLLALIPTALLAGSIVAAVGAILALPFLIFKYIFDCLFRNEKENDALLRSCERLAYSVGTATRGNFRTCLIVKILSFSKAVQLLNEYIKLSSTTFVSVVPDEIMKSPVDISNFLLKDQEARMKLEIAVPQLIFLKIFGESFEVGTVSANFYYKSTSDALRAQHALLKNLMAFKNASGTIDGIPHKLKTDLITLFQTSDINLDVKSEMSIERKIQSSRHKGEGGSTKFRDLVRCRVLVFDMYQMWSNLMFLLVGNLQSLNCSGVQVEMQQPKPKDQENYENLIQKLEGRSGFQFLVDVLGHEYIESEWYGLYLYLYYDGQPVEVQVMSYKSMLHIGTNLSHGIRDILMRAKNGQINTGVGHQIKDKEYEAESQV